jgi:site-specific DNA-methyltransferase (adenine-specific)
MKPYYEHAGITIYHGDCRDVMEQWEGLRTQSFDLLLTDPPYGINLGDAGGRGSHGWAIEKGSTLWDLERPSHELLASCRRICRKSVIWGGNYFDLPMSMGWLVWDKGQRDFSLADGELAWTSEQRALRIFSYARSKALQDGKEHPTQKPLELMAWCLSMFGTSRTIFDPFMGSGSTIVAAKRLGKQATGIEREEKYCEIAARRLQQEVLPLEMPA